jgi:hypothetical protein|tara:strand:+ start:3387 stop:3791 length:405 start_codon:yes stop_codon:yes gene_type:complete
MAKESGIAMSIAVDDSGSSARTISNDITNFDFSTPRNVQVVTGIDKSAEERLQLLADFTITLNGVFNDAANVAHAVFATVPSSSVARTVTITISGQSLPNETFFNDYAISRPASGELTWTAPGTLSGGTVPTWA